MATKTEKEKADEKRNKASAVKTRPISTTGQTVTAATRKELAKAATPKPREDETPEDDGVSDEEKIAKHEEKQAVEGAKAAAAKTNEEVEAQQDLEMSEDAEKAKELTDEEQVLEGHGATIPERATAGKYRTDHAARAATEGINTNPSYRGVLKSAQRVNKENLELMLKKPSYDKPITLGEQVPLHAANLQARATETEVQERKEKVVTSAVRAAMRKVPT